MYWFKDLKIERRIYVYQYIINKRKEAEMKNLNIPVGISDFERIRELNYYYVDKTGLIKTLLQGEMDQVTLITRPRRFGKTMAMNMVASFLDIRKDSKELFDLSLIHI